MFRSLVRHALVYNAPLVWLGAVVLGVLACVEEYGAHTFAAGEWRGAVVALTVLACCSAGALLCRRPTSFDEYAKAARQSRGTETAGLTAAGAVAVSREQWQRNRAVLLAHTLFAVWLATQLALVSARAIWLCEYAGVAAGMRTEMLRQLQAAMAQSTTLLAATLVVSRQYPPGTGRRGADL